MAIRSVLTVLFQKGLGLCFLAVASGVVLASIDAPGSPASRDATLRVSYANSVREISATQKATLHTMTAAHLGDSIGFNIPLAIRNQADLETRVNRGEVIPGDELKEKYFPLQSDYDNVAAWLKSEGFTVDTIGDTHLAVFAHGTVAQVQNSLQMTMGLVTAKGADQVIALTAPSLPTTVAGPALGISGLSYRRPRSRLAHPGPNTTANAIR